MSHQYLVTLGSLQVWLISPGTSRVMIHRAERLIVRIMAKDVVRGMRPKVLKGNKRWLSYRVNRKYRLLVRREWALLPKSILGMPFPKRVPGIN